MANRRRQRGKTGIPWRESDVVVSRERNKVRAVHRMRQFRRVATRYDQPSRTFLKIVLFVAITLWLKGL